MLPGGSPSGCPHLTLYRSGANVYMPDFEDSNCPTWRNLIEGQVGGWVHGVTRVEWVDGEEAVGGFVSAACPTGLPGLVVSSGCRWVPLGGSCLVAGGCC